MKRVIEFESNKLFPFMQDPDASKTCLSPKDAHMSLISTTAIVILTYTFATIIFRKISSGPPQYVIFEASKRERS